MKRFFSLCVLLASAMFGMASCGGGDNNSDDPITVQQFKGASRKFVLRGATDVHIIPTDVISGAGYNDSDTTCLVNGYFTYGSNQYRVSLKYTITSVFEDEIQTATLSMSIADSDLDEVNNNAAFMATLTAEDNIDTNESSRTLLQRPLEFQVDYVTRKMQVDVVYQINYKTGYTAIGTVSPTFEFYTTSV